jgi:hypothetical protein
MHNRFTFLFRIFWVAGILVLLKCSPAPKQFSELQAEETGLDFRNDLVETQQTNILTYEYAYNGAGVAAGDINNDGLADLYFSGNSVPNKLFLNKGNWKFADITSQSATVGRKDWKTGVTMADVNGDGWLDIYVCYSGNAPGEGYNLPVIRDYLPRANQLFINNGCVPGGVPTFSERAIEFGLDAIGTFSTQAYFFDYDLDGDLDMFLVNHANMFYAAFFNTRKLRNLRHPYFGNRLYRNDDGKFSDVSRQAGFHGSGLNFGLSAAISDLNADHWPDIYVTNDFEEQDFCYINNRDGTFREVSHTLFSHLSKFGMGSDIADINNDALPDIFVLDMLPEDNYRQKLLKGPDEHDRYTLAVDSGYHHQYMRNTLQLNRGLAPDSLPRFSEIAQFAGVSNTDWSWTPFLVDLDNDGLKDIFVTNGYLRDYTNLDYMKYTGDVYNKARTNNSAVDYQTLIQQLPVTRLNNYVFQNRGGINFKNVSEEWGLTRKSVSNGAAYADLDNDGDYDIVINNLNDQATLLRNNQNEIQKNNYLKIRLKGKNRNTAGAGAKIKVVTDSAEIFQEAFFTRGYASSVEPVLTIGIGKSKTIKEVNVYWPDSSLSTFTNIPPNQTLVIDQREGKKNSSGFLTKTSANPILHDVTDQSGLDFRHKENNFIDFKVQRLLFYQLSRLGGKLAAGDVNSDGNDDVFFGGASGQSGELFLGKDDGTFYKSENQPWHSDALHEDMESVFFDADRDGDQDLYVVSGGSEFASDGIIYQDRLYLNNGKAVFSRSIDALPAETSSGSCVVAADYDKDGDVDLFVGGRIVPGSYGIIPRSFILRNDTQESQVRFTEVTVQVNEALANPGMVTCAVWTDYNNDSWPDLILTGEWMPIRIFKNQNGKLLEVSDVKWLEKSNGWWCSIHPADIDKDGDMDYFLGNAGNNLQFHATQQEPVQLFARDFNKDGMLDPLLFHYIQGKSYPLASRDELLDQISALRKKFIKYENYANATLPDIASQEEIDKAYSFNAYTLQSMWMENVEGKNFVIRPLPSLAHFSSVNGFLVDDFSGDGKNEILMAGNFYPYKAQLGKSDASAGLIVNFENGQIRQDRSVLSNVWLTGDIRDIALLKFKSGVKRVIVSRNNEKAGVYKPLK